MSLATQLPGLASVSFVRGDDWGASLDFSIDTTGYTWAAVVESVPNGSTVATPTVTILSAALGQISVNLSRTQTAAIAPGTYRLKITGTASGGTVRRATQGTIEVKA
jgi:hypothetical protein